jgi:hypothetical protein
MRGSFYLLGAGLTVTGLLAAIGNITGQFQPWLWCAATGLLVLVITSLTDKGIEE